MGKNDYTCFCLTQEYHKDMDKERESPTPRYEMMVSESALGSENPLTVHDSESEIHDGPALQENDDGEMMITESSLVGEIHVGLYDSGSEIHDGPPLQENDDGEMMVAELALGGENPVTAHDPGSEIHDGPPLQENDDGQMMVAESSLAGEIHVVVYDPGRTPIQETGDGQMVYQQPEQVGLNPNIMSYGSGASPDLEELGGVIIGPTDGNGLVEVLVMSVETSPAIVNEL